MPPRSKSEGWIVNEQALLYGKRVKFTHRIVENGIRACDLLEELNSHAQQRNA